MTLILRFFDVTCAASIDGIPVFFFLTHFYSNLRQWLVDTLLEMALNGVFTGLSCLMRLAAPGRSLELPVAAALCRTPSVLPQSRVQRLRSRRYSTNSTTENATSDKDAAEAEQAFPLNGYYELLYDIPQSPRLRQAVLHEDKDDHDAAKEDQQRPSEKKAASSKSATGNERVEYNSAQQDSPPKQESPKELSPRERVGIVFGSRLASPGYTPSRYRSSSEAPPALSWKLLNGVRIPPRPVEPDNCCMSGCVNCVWDNYRDDLESWAEQVRAAKALGSGREKKKEEDRSRISGAQDVPASTSMDDDGSATVPYWGTGLSDSDMFGNIPVGIREFMKTEKRLKQRKAGVNRQ